MLFHGTGLNVVTIGRYIGEFIRDGMDEATWMGEKVRGWEGGVDTLAGVEHCNTHTDYSGMKNDLQ